MTNQPPTEPIKGNEQQGDTKPTIVKKASTPQQNVLAHSLTQKTSSEAMQQLASKDEMITAQGTRVVRNPDGSIVVFNKEGRQMPGRKYDKGLFDVPLTHDHIGLFYTQNDSSQSQGMQATAGYDAYAGGMTFDTTALNMMTQGEEPLQGWGNSEAMAKYLVSHELTHMRWETIPSEVKAQIIETFSQGELADQLKLFGSTLTRSLYYKWQGFIITNPDAFPDYPNKGTMEYQDQSMGIWNEGVYDKTQMDNYMEVDTYLDREGDATEQRWFRKELLVNELLGYGALPSSENQDAIYAKAAAIRDKFHEANQERVANHQEPLGGEVQTYPSLVAATKILALVEEKYPELYNLLKQNRLVDYQDFPSDYDAIKQSLTQLASS